MFFYFLQNRHFSQGANYQTLSWMFRIGKSTARKVVLETGDIIWKKLKDIYVSEPNEQQFSMISDEFYKKWNFPNVCGALDGKHFAVQCPPNSGSQYYNYKGFYSIVLMAVCDANYKFTMVDVGSTGSENDASILRSSSFGDKILNDKICLPLAKNLPNTNLSLPHFFVGDGIFPLRKNLMKPFAGRQLPLEKQIFNYRLSRARRTIENAFGILISRWKIFSTTITGYLKYLLLFVFS